jgi:sialidase-1
MKTAWTYIVLMAVIFSTTAVIAKEAVKEKKVDSVKDSAKPFLEMTDLFQNGKAGYSMYHIPGIAVTAKGTVLAWGEARKGNSDWAKMDILLRRSTDNGLTFGEPIMIGHIDGPHTRNSINTKGLRVTTDNPTYNNPVLIPDRDGTVHGLFCIEYCRAYYLRSDDDGVTWSKPVEITSAFEKFRSEYDWQVIATGPNHGIQLKNGRLVVPVWLSTSQKSPHHPSVAAVIFSDDGGKTWQAGDIAVPCTAEWQDPSETVAVELSDGRVMLNVRNTGGKKRLVTISPNGATNWSKPRFDDMLPGTVCMAGLVRYPAKSDNGPVRLLFSLPSYPAGEYMMIARRDLKIFMRSDDGQTWPVSRMLWGGGKGAAYSDLAVAADGTIFCFFGRGLNDKHTWGGDRLTLARFNMAWLLEGEPQGEYRLPKVAEDQIFGASEDGKSKPQGENK